MIIKKNNNNVQLYKHISSTSILQYKCCKSIQMANSLLNIYKNYTKEALLGNNSTLLHIYVE